MNSRMSVEGFEGATLQFWTLDQRIEREAKMPLPRSPLSILALALAIGQGKSEKYLNSTFDLTCIQYGKTLLLAFKEFKSLDKNFKARPRT